MMREMLMEDLLSYNVSEIDLFYEDGQVVKLPPRGMEKKLSLKDGPSAGSELIIITRLDWIR